MRNRTGPSTWAHYKLETVQHAVSEPTPANTPNNQALTQGGGASSDALRAEPLSFKKTRIMQSGGRQTVPHIPPDLATSGKPESLSGSQTEGAGINPSDNNIPPTESIVKNG
jgi:hypothetical protein